MRGGNRCTIPKPHRHNMAIRRVHLHPRRENSTQIFCKAGLLVRPAAVTVHSGGGVETDTALWLLLTIYAIHCT